MASLLNLKKRITTAQNVSKTTRAMQMIATSKLKRAQDAALSSRPYVEKLQNVTKNLVPEIGEDIYHPYLKPPSITSKLLIVLTPDKGLCGGLITNLMRELLRQMDKNKNIKYVTFGKKGETQATGLKGEIIASFPFGGTTPSFDAVYPIARIIDDEYLNNKVGSVEIIYSRFVNIFSQSPTISTILPITISNASDVEEKKNSLYLFEPNLNTILPSLLKHYLEMTIYQYLLENFASEQASRMMAMQNATENAKEIIEELKLEYNKTRQARITNEILDITAGSVFLYE